MSQLVLALMTLVLVQNANADLRSALDLKNAAIAGTGCKPGEANLSVAGDVLQIRTPKLSTVTDQASGLSRKSCAVAIPFKLRSNERLVISAGRLNVALNLKRGAVARTSAELFVGGSQSSRVQTVDNGPKNQLSLLRVGSVTTACGADGLLRLNMSQVLQAKNIRSQARVNGAVLRVQVAKCN